MVLIRKVVVEMFFSFFKRRKSKIKKLGSDLTHIHGFSNEQLMRIQALAQERLERAEARITPAFKPETLDKRA